MDNFSRPGSEKNLLWLKSRHRKRLKVIAADIRNGDLELRSAVEGADAVFHLAAQVAVTTSVTDPREDFEINAQGTFNVLEAVRHSASQPILLYSSTNKVYGKMADLGIVERGGRYAYDQMSEGISERRPLDPYSPYGCSKCAGDQYVLDYARIYGLKTVVFRQSCIYGPRQFGMEDQGWLAWFSIRAFQQKPVTIYGDGKQVRDVLYRSGPGGGLRRRRAQHRDHRGPRLQRGRRAVQHALAAGTGGIAGQEVLAPAGVFLRGMEARRPAGLRQRHLASHQDFGWYPGTGVRKGLGLLLEWIENHAALFGTGRPAAASLGVAR